MKKYILLTNHNPVQVYRIKREVKECSTYIRQDKSQKEQVCVNVMVEPIEMIFPDRRICKRVKHNQMVINPSVDIIFESEDYLNHEDVMMLYPEYFL